MKFVLKQEKPKAQEVAPVDVTPERLTDLAIKQFVREIVGSGKLVEGYPQADEDEDRIFAVKWRTVEGALIEKFFLAYLQNGELKVKQRGQAKVTVGNVSVVV